MWCEEGSNVLEDLKCAIEKSKETGYNGPVCSVCGKHKPTFILGNYFCPQCYLDEYNRRAGTNYTMEECLKDLTIEDIFPWMRKK